MKNIFILKTRLCALRFPQSYAKVCALEADKKLFFTGGAMKGR